MRIVIVGAGVAGCILARSLSRLPGVDVTCLERVEAGDHSESGTGLNVGPNGVEALRAHDADLAQAVTAASLPWRSWKVSLTDGTVLFDLPLAKVASTDGWRIRWSDLYGVLRQGAASAIVYGATVKHAALCESDPTKVRIEWTERASHKRLDAIDLLVAADGRYSQVRRAISGEPAVRHVGVAISRALVPDTSGGLIDDYEQWFSGPNRLLGFRVPPAHIYVTCAFPIPPEEPIAEALKRPDALRHRYLPAGGGDLSQSALWMLDQLCAHASDLHWARMQEHELLYADSQRNVFYLGDAAHGMVPTLGQGATQAIEDAVAAAGIIAQELTARQRNPRRWLQSIARKRSERMRFAMQFSLEATDTLLGTIEPVAGTLQKLGPEFQAKLRRLYSEGAAK
jgi:salicylate hydroxylase